MHEAQVRLAANEAMLFDGALGNPPPPDWFERGHWQARGRAQPAPGGRGGVLFVETPAGACALRHYHRGGLAARVSADRYLWTGADRTRAFREFRLLAHLVRSGLPVAAPVAARYVRDGLTYRADLLTRRIAVAQTLAERLAEGSLDPALGAKVGQAIARFHAAGVWHADLNAHNVLVDGSGGIRLIDFDRGRLRTPAARWRRANLARLHRSFEKLGAGAQPAFEPAFWRPLLSAYGESLSRADAGVATTGSVRP
jgi:3-deoxy-D-manno-octulosonic acid kinase